MRMVWVGFSVVLLLGCPEKPRPPVFVAVDAGPIEIDAGPPVDAGPPLPSSLDPTVVAAFRDGGTAPVTAKSEIDQASSLSISLPIKLKDFRIRLLDFRDQVVVSDDELTADGRTYVISLAEPLKTGRGYTLVLDAELGPVVTDDSGGTWNDWELDFRIAGDVQPEPGAAKKAKNKKH